MKLNKNVLEELANMTLVMNGILSVMNGSQRSIDKSTLHKMQSVQASLNQDFAKKVCSLYEQETKVEDTEFVERLEVEKAKVKKKAGRPKAVEKHSDED